MSKLVEEARESYNKIGEGDYTPQDTYGLLLIESYEKMERVLRELTGYVRAHLAGNDADPELKWALEQADKLTGATDDD